MNPTQQLNQKEYVEQELAKRELWEAQRRRAEEQKKLHDVLEKYEESFE